MHSVSSSLGTTGGFLLLRKGLELLCPVGDDGQLSPVVFAELSGGVSSEIPRAAANPAAAPAAAPTILSMIPGEAASSRTSELPRFSSAEA